MKSVPVWLVILSLLILIPIGMYTACKVPASQPETNAPENGSLPTQPTEPAEPDPKKPAAFEVGELQIPATCMAGDPITVKDEELARRFNEGVKGRYKIQVFSGDSLASWAYDW